MYTIIIQLLCSYAKSYLYPIYITIIGSTTFFHHTLWYLVQLWDFQIHTRTVNKLP